MLDRATQNIAESDGAARTMANLEGNPQLTFWYCWRPITRNGQAHLESGSNTRFSIDSNLTVFSVPPHNGVGGHGKDRAPRPFREIKDRLGLGQSAC
jgi:hypothetical protein